MSDTRRCPNPKVVVTRELADMVMQRMDALFDTTNDRHQTAMTRDQLDAAASSAAAAAAAKITAGAAVKDTAGGSVGTIKSIEGEFALLDTSAVQVKLPLTAFAASGDGVVVSMTKAQIEAAAAASKPAAAR